MLGGIFHYLDFAFSKPTNPNFGRLVKQLLGHLRKILDLGIRAWD